MESLPDDSISLYLISEEGDKIEYKYKILQRSNLIKASLKKYPDKNTFEITKIKSKILIKIKEYLEYYSDKEPKEIEKPLKSDNYKECVDEWDYNYINLDIDELLEIILAANFLDIYPLSQLACSKVSSLLKGKNVNELSNILNIKNDKK